MKSMLSTFLKVCGGLFVLFLAVGVWASYSKSDPVAAAAYDRQLKVQNTPVRGPKQPILGGLTNDDIIGTWTDDKESFIFKADGKIVIFLKGYSRIESSWAFSSLEEVTVEGHPSQHFRLKVSEDHSLMELTTWDENPTKRETILLRKVPD